MMSHILDKKFNFKLLFARFLSGILFLLPVLSLIFATSNTYASAYFLGSQFGNRIIVFHAPSWSSWKFVERVKNNFGDFSIFVPQAASDSSSNQSVRIGFISYANRPVMTPESAFDFQVKSAQNYCRDVNAKIIFKNTNSLMYTLDGKNCSRAINEKIIGKIFRSSAGLHVAIYSAVDGRVSDVDYKIALNMIKASTLGTVQIKTLANGASKIYIKP